MHPFSFSFSARDTNICYVIIEPKKKNHDQEKQGGMIGIVIAAPWYEPYDDTPADRLAVQRSLAFKFAWYMSSLLHKSMFYGPKKRNPHSIL